MSAPDHPAAFMREAIRLSREGMQSRQGGPFGAVIVRDGEIIARGCNQVTSTHDPTAHAEMVAIREAGRRLNTFSLAGCELYASSEPCPMCLAAIYWARLDRVYYGNPHAAAADIGFDDSLIYRELALSIPQRALPMENLLREEAAAVFQEWTTLANRQPY